GEFRPRTISIQTVADEVQTIAIELKPESGKAEKIQVKGLSITIADEATFLIEASGEQLTLAQYLDYTKGKILGYVPDWVKLHAVWIDVQKRSDFLRSLGSVKK
ncbi:MAG: EcoAI/FtnUII family type I restriction enzme subunit R, partial [Planctomycetota bacterium]